MKKILVCFCVFLSSVAIIGLFFEFTHEYAQERVLWWIQHDFQRIDHPTSPENENVVNKIVLRYQSFIKKNPKSTLIPKSKLMLGNTLRLQNKYPEAREIFKEIATNYRYNTEVAAQAEFEIAQSFENEDNWPKAVTIYRMISKEYPLTSIGFSIPFYLGIFYHSRGLNSTAFNAFDEAAEFYRNISTNYPDSSLGLAALQMIVKCRLLLGEWTEAFYAAREAFLKYPLAASLLDTIKTIQDISIKNIHDPQLAIDVYQEFLQRNPGHPIKNTLIKIINKLQSPRK